MNKDYSITNIITDEFRKNNYYPDPIFSGRSAPDPGITHPDPQPCLVYSAKILKSFNQNTFPAYHLRKVLIVLDRIIVIKLTFDVYILLRKAAKKSFFLA